MYKIANKNDQRPNINLIIHSDYNLATPQSDSRHQAFYYQNIPMTDMKTFGGTHKENFRLWMRQFKYAQKMNLIQKNFALHIYAPSFLIDEAASYYD